MSTSFVFIAQLETESTARERALQRKLGLPLLSLNALDAERHSFYLQYGSDGLALHAVGESAPGALRVDFASLLRRAGDGLIKQNLLKAVGARKGRRPSVLDATAGLGTDSFLLSKAGCEVLALERNAVVYALVEDGIARYRQAESKGAETDAVFAVRNEDFLSVHSSLPKFQVVYLDPMFPPKTKSAQSKKAMSYLQEIVGKSSNDADLFDAARELASDRIVVKRAKQSPLINNAEPSHSFKGSSSRFDVYLLN
ncbi:MAG: class I SAM-dependent methyltransferase [Gammaproteobacteria bacterium]|nr:class I SAM-dependent methyltransferase [Gammaproteobacteria bacterium]MDD9896747.1 class I SAM-dependent methyltransferase [Gammaproteobacteria bacterium]MDD9957773.1 class I SAM-dependent methyltransferase [Gammaproteobacteria bacterium]